MTSTDKQIVQAAELYATMQNRLKGYDRAIRKAFIEGALSAGISAVLEPFKEYFNEKN